MSYVDPGELQAYLEKYVQAYLDAVKAKPGAKEPPFARGAPHRVHAFILPNHSVIVLTTFNSPPHQVIVAQSSVEQVKQALAAGPAPHFMSYYPTTSFTEADAVTDAQSDVARDLRSATYRASLAAARLYISKGSGNLRDLAKTNPWLEGQLSELATKLDKGDEPLKQLVDAEERTETDAPKGFEAKIDRMAAVATDNPPGIDEQRLSTYINTYLDTYKAGIRPDLPAVAMPLFAKGRPLRVRGAILPNETVAILVKFGAPSDQVQVARETFESFEALVRARDHDLLATYPPLRNFGAGDAASDAKANVMKDSRNGLHRALLASTRNILSDVTMKVQETVKTNPWLEQPMANSLSILKGVGQLLETLGSTLERNERGMNPAEEISRVENLRRFKTPGAGGGSGSPLEDLLAGAGISTAPSPAPAPAPRPAPAPAPAMAPSAPRPAPAPAPAPASRPGPGPGQGGAPPQRPPQAPGQGPRPGPGPGPAPQAAGQPQQQRPVGAGLSPQDRQMIDGLRAEMYNLRQKIDGFDQRLRYLDNLSGKLLADTNEKLRLQTEVVKAEVSAGNKATWAFGITAMIIAIISIVGNYSTVLETLRRVFGGG